MAFFSRAYSRLMNAHISYFAPSLVSGSDANVLEQAAKQALSLWAAVSLRLMHVDSQRCHLYKRRYS